MIHYHGLPITPETAAAVVLTGGHGFVCHTEDRNLALVAAVCQSWAGDNGAFPAWKSGKPITDWAPYYAWAADAARYPNCDFCVIPDVIDGDEAANNALLAEWPLPRWFGAPVWHMHEGLDRLVRLAADYPRVCLGSSGEFATVGTAKWWARMGQAMLAVCDTEGRPLVRLHGLRMLNPRVFSRLPLASADSTNIARNIGIDSAWKGTYQPCGTFTKEARALVMRQRIESVNGADRWRFQRPETQPEQGALL